MDALEDLLFRQSGVVNRRQVLDVGLETWDLRRLVRNRDLVRVHAGVYVNHTGPPDWLQRAWAAVLAVQPGALWGPSAMRAAQGPGLRDHDNRGPIHVAVDEPRSLSAPARVILHRVKQLDERAMWNTSPPRVRLEEAVLDVAALASDEHAVVAALANAVQSRMTTPGHLRRALAGRSRIARRRMLNEIIADVASGSCSALERAYLLKVERAHGLPAGLRQVRASPRGPVFRDIEYGGRLVIELDGRLDHTRFTERTRDLDRDLDALVDGKVTVRLGWGLVVGRSCDTAIRVDRLLQALDIPSDAASCAQCGWRGIWAA